MTEWVENVDMMGRLTGHIESDSAVYMQIGSARFDVGLQIITGRLGDIVILSPAGDWTPKSRLCPKCEYDGFVCEVCDSTGYIWETS